MRRRSSSCDPWGAKVYARGTSDTEVKYIKLPVNWLRERKWEEDEKSVLAQAKPRVTYKINYAQV